MNSSDTTITVRTFENLQVAEAAAETAIHQVNDGLESFAKVIKEIRDGRLYEQSGAASFKEYCAKRWGKSVRTVQRAIATANMRQLLLETVSGKAKEAVRKASPRALAALNKVPAEKRVKAVEKMAETGAIKSGSALRHVSDLYTSANPAPTVAKPVQVQAPFEHQVADFLLQWQAVSQQERDYLNYLSEQIRISAP